MSLCLFSGRSFGSRVVFYFHFFGYSTLRDERSRGVTRYTTRGTAVRLARLFRRTTRAPREGACGDPPGRACPSGVPAPGRVFDLFDDTNFVVFPPPLHEPCPR